jgi:hypothetical protein
MGYQPDLNAKIDLSIFVMLNSTRLEKLACNHHHILVTALPKSGSSWLSEIFSQLPHQSRVGLLPGEERRENELAFERLLAYHGMNYTAQHHVKYSTTTAAYLNIFSIKPVVLVRNLFDLVLSIKDWVDTCDPSFRRGPVACIDDDYLTWSDNEKFDFIIDMFMPWYFFFFSTWQECPDCSWVKYEDLLADPQAMLTRLSGELDLGLSQDAIEGALKKAASMPTKKNMCQVGRGEILTSAQKDRIRKFASYYPTRDFSAIGL